MVASPRALVLAGGKLVEGPAGVALAEDQIPLDSAEHEFTPGLTGGVATAAGNTIVYTPAAGKTLRLHWIYTLSKPSSSVFPLITVMLGSKTICTTYGISKRKKVTAANPGDALVVVLDQPGSVAYTFDIEEF